jgi:hypothetical protein
MRMAWACAAAALVAGAISCRSAQAPAGGEEPGPTGPTKPGPGPEPTPPSACKTTEVFRSPLRRLTRLEYNNTVRDLLGDSSAPADRFPPDEVSNGFSNNAAVLSVSPLLAEKYQESAEALAATAVKNLAALVACDPARMGADACARQFVQEFGRRAYRRPLSAGEIDRLLKVYASGGDFARGIEVVLRAILQSPGFLYRLELSPAPAGGKLARLGGYEVATRLSYLLWATMPDQRLFTAAEKNELGTPAQVAAVARTMLDDPRTRRAASEFYRQWLGLGAIDTMVKDAAVYPELTPELRAGMRAEIGATIEHLLWTGDRKLQTLFTAPIGFVTPALARLYGTDGAGMVGLPEAQRAGILTQAGVLAVYSLPNQSSPVHRGKFVREMVLCQELPPQPPNLMVSPPEVDPRRPTRERFRQHAEDAACSVCHRLMDPVGFGFEAYDGLGRFRAMDGGGAVDASGELTDTRDADGPFRGARELAERLGKSAEVRDCVATQWYRYALGRLEGPGDTCSLRQLRDTFTASGGDLRDLLVAVTQTEAFLNRPVSP